MFSAKNIHIGLLGVILGATSAYIYASHQAEGRLDIRAQEALQAFQAQASADHPEVSDEEMLVLFEQALTASPNDPELMARYGNFLFNLQRFFEAVEWYRKVLAIDPGDAQVRTDLATALYNMGLTDDAISEYRAAIDSDPNQVMAMHNLVIAWLESSGDVVAAEATMRRIEQIDPNYPGLVTLRQRVAEARAAAGSN